MDKEAQLIVIKQRLIAIKGNNSLPFDEWLNKVKIGVADYYKTKDVTELHETFNGSLLSFDAWLGTIILEIANYVYYKNYSIEHY